MSSFSTISDCYITLIVCFPSKMNISKSNHIRAVYAPKHQERSIKQGLTLIPNPQKYANLFGQSHKFSDKFNDEHAKKEKEVSDAFGLAGGDAMKSLVMFDTLHRLGIDYHFKWENDLILKACYASFGANINKHQDPEETALHFRLLRREGYTVSQDVFIRFMDDEGKFKNDLIAHINGLMSLHEASQLKMEGEKILEDAKDLAEQILSDFCTNYSHQAALVNKTFMHPHHKTLARVHAKNFLQTYEGESQMETSNVLCELAKLDFSIVQSFYQNEASQVSKWWDELGLSKELKFARNQPIKWYMWPLAIVEDPRRSEERIELTKSISLVYIVDDVFDVYGTIEDLSLFTEVVSRWDHATAEKLPDYMKMCFKALNDTTNEMSYKIMKRIGWSPTEALRKSWATLFNAFLVEAKWLSTSNMPSADEYLKNGVVSTGVHVVLLHLFFLLGDGVNAASIRYLTDGGPRIFDSIGRILRLCDDLGSAEDENKKGKDGSYLDCYLKEHKGVSIASAKEHVSLMISETWERLIEESFSPSLLSASFIKYMLNAARMIPLMYNYDDNHSLPGLDEQLKSIRYSSLL